MPPVAHRILHRLRYPYKIVTDLAVWSAAGIVAYLLRFDLTIPVAQRSDMWIYLAIALFVKLGAVLAFRLNASSWRKVTFRDAVTLAWAVATVTVILLTVTALLRPDVTVPRSIPLVDAGVALLGLAAVRAAGRWRDEWVRDGGMQETRSALIIGAGEAGTLLVREMLRHPEMGLRPIGFVDDDSGKLGMRVGGVEVLGGRNRIAEILSSHPVDEVLIATPSADGRFIRETVERVRAATAKSLRKVQTRVMPGVYELLSGDVSVRRLREVRVEDLLRREPVQLELASIRDYVRGRTVLVTGAGGSIGGELARQLATFGPKKLLLLGRGENSIYAIDRELTSVAPNVAREALIASVQDADRMRTVLERHRPEVVFHAAAHKHVPLMEAHPEEAVLNNVIGTLNVLRAAKQHGVTRFVNVSTDKAVNPTSVMGATKRLAECLVQRAAAEAEREPGNEAKYVSVRFGNVLGSRGSVVPLFRKQIEDGGPVTITDRRMTRYFMTVPEAAQLVLQAGALASNGAVYILDMGEPVRIVDLAEDLIRLSGLEPGLDIEIREVGARPGEKLHEQLTEANAQQERAVFEKIFVARTGGVETDRLPEIVASLLEASLRGDRASIVRQLHEALSSEERTSAVAS